MLSRISSSTGPIKPSKSSDIVQEGLICRYEISTPGSYSSAAGSTVTDLVGNSNAVTQNSPSYSSPGQSTGIPGYLEFNGSTQYLLTQTSLNPKLSPANTSTVIAVFVWAYMSDNGVIVSELGQTTINAGWHDSQIERVTGTVKFSVWQNATGFASSIPTSTNTWYYIGFTYDGSTLTGYVNGASAGSAAYTRTAPYSAALGLHYGLAAIDSTSLGDGTYAACRIGAFHVYNTAISTAQVLSNFNAQRNRYYP
jgi:Concanavalin A-like lectin/glucanases superfamily